MSLLEAEVSNSSCAVGPLSSSAYCRGIKLFEAGDYAGACAAYAEAIEVAPDHAQAHNNRGAARMALGDRQGAFADYDRALALNPNLAQAYNNRGHARYLAGDLTAALADLEQAIRLDPSYAQAYDNCAAVHNKGWEHAKAVAHYTRALDLYSQSAGSSERICCVLILRAFALYHLRALQPALADLRRAYRLDPSVCATHVARVLEHDARQQFGFAIQNSNQHLAENPGDFFAVIRRGLTYLIAGRTREYQADYLAVLQTTCTPADRLMVLDFLETVQQRLATCEFQTPSPPVLRGRGPG